MDERLLKQTAYCGLHCPACYKMVVSSAAENLRDALQNTHICGSKNDATDEFKQGLQYLVNLKCNKFCREGGGNPDCKIKICCKDKKFDGCWGCKSLETCDLLTEQFKELCVLIRSN